MAKIVGNVVGLPNPQPDWNQTNKTKADYIKNKPRIGYEADLQWGGEHLANTTSPLDAALINSLSANRFALMPPEFIKIEEQGERFDENGHKITKWQEKAVSDKDKIALVTNATYISMSKTFTYDNNVFTTKKIRVTFTVPKDSMYMLLKKLLVQFGCGGRINGATCIVSVSDYSNPSIFTDILNCDVNGDAGWNVIQINDMYLGGLTSSPNSHLTSIRLTFEPNEIEGITPYGQISLWSIYAIAPNCWLSLNPLQKTNSLYEVDSNGNAIFYKGVQADAFTGVVTRAIADENGDNIAASLANIKSQIPILKTRSTGIVFSPVGWKKEITMGTVTIKAEDKGFTYVAPYVSTAEFNIEKASDVKQCLLKLVGNVTLEERRAFENAHMYIDFTYDSANKIYQFYCGITSEEPPKILIHTILTLFIQRS